MGTIGRPRRYYLGKRRQALAQDSDLHLTWQALQEAEPGTPLAANFPYRTSLAAQGYTTVEDLDGATAAELSAVGFSAGEASTILAAIAAAT